MRERERETAGDRDEGERGRRRGERERGRRRGGAEPEAGTDHPDHDVGEAGDPHGGREEGHHEPLLPGLLVAVGHGEEQQQAQRPHGQPLELVARPRWKTRGPR